MNKKYNITDKSTSEDFNKIFMKELVIRKANSLRNKQDRKEYNFLKSAMTSKRK